MIESLRTLKSLPQYQQLSRSIKRFARLTALNELTDRDYDLSVVREEINVDQNTLTKSIKEGSKQYKKWTDHSKLRIYTVVTCYDYEGYYDDVDDNSFHYYCAEGDHSEYYRAQNHQVIVTDRKLPKIDHNSKSLDALCGEWMCRDLYQYIKLTLENFNGN